MDDDLGFCRLVENHVAVRQCRQAPNGRIIRAGADAGIQQQKVDDRLNASLNAPRALRRVGRDVIEDRVEVGEGRKSVAELQAVFGPRGPHLLIGRKPSVRSGGFRGRNRGTFVL